MPRQRKTQSGDPALAVTSTPGVRYGEGQELQELQRSVPTPNARTQSAAPAPTPTPPQGGGQPPRPMPSPGALLSPTQRPNEPLTAGLDMGPGPGSDALGRNPSESPTGRFLRQLASVTGRQQFAELARRNRL